MRGITIKMPEALLEQLSAEAQATGRSVAAIVRDKLEARMGAAGTTVYDETADLAGTLVGSIRPATHERRKFRHS